MIGVPNDIPKTPKFVILKVDPSISSIKSLFSLALDAIWLIDLQKPRKFFSSQPDIEGTINPFSIATARPILIFL